MSALYKILGSHKIPLGVLLIFTGALSFRQAGFWGLGFWFLMSAFGFWYARNEDKLW